jgi:hypothetical protein
MHDFESGEMEIPQLEASRIVGRVRVVILALVAIERRSWKEGDMSGVI